MPYTIQSPTHGDLQFSEEIPDQLEDLVKPATEAYAAVGPFGDFLFQPFKGQDFTVSQHYAFPKEQVVTMNKEDGPALYISIVLNGQVIQKVADQKAVELKDWRFYLAFIPRPTTVATTYKPGMDVRYITIRLGIGLLKEINKSCPLPAEVFTHFQSDAHVIILPESKRITNTLFFSLTDIMSNYLQPFHREYFFSTKINYLSVMLLYEAFNTQDQQVPNKEMEIVIKAKKLIEESVSLPLSGREIAWQVGLNYFRLKRVFKEVVGSSLADYIVSTRLNHARTLLQDKEMSIKQIAAFCGYKSADSFITAFRKRFNVTPDVLRKRLM